MKAILFLNGPQGELALRSFPDPESLAVVVPAGADNSLIERMCRERAIACMERLKDQPVALTAGSYDYLVSSSFPYRILAAECNAARLAAVNLHGAILPKYKGKNAGVWALINDEKRVGMTMHRISEKFDAGEILHIDIHEINDGMSLQEIQGLLDRSVPKLVNFLLSGEVFKLPRPVIGSESIFWRARTIHDSRINWHVPARKTFLFIRALSREPIYAYSHYNGVQYRIKRAMLSSQTSGSLPGAVVNMDDRLYVVCGDGRCLEITDYDGQGVSMAPGMVLH